MSGSLRLRRDDADLFPHERIHQGRFTGIWPADYRDKTGLLSTVSQRPIFPEVWPPLLVQRVAQVAPEPSGGGKRYPIVYGSSAPESGEQAAEPLSTDGPSASPESHAGKTGSRGPRNRFLRAGVIQAERRAVGPGDNRFVARGRQAGRDEGVASGSGGQRIHTRNHDHRSQFRRFRR